MKTLALGEAQPKQQEFFRARRRYIAYGGARGGGKSWAARTKAILLGFAYHGLQGQHKRIHFSYRKPAETRIL